MRLRLGIRPEHRWWSLQRSPATYSYRDAREVSVAVRNGGEEKAGRRKDNEGRETEGEGRKEGIPTLMFFFSHKLTTNQVYITGGPLATEN